MTWAGFWLAFFGLSILAFCWLLLTVTVGGWKDLGFLLRHESDLQASSEKPDDRG